MGFPNSPRKKAMNDDVLVDVDVILPKISLRKRLNLRDSGALPETARGEQPQERETKR